MMEYPESLVDHGHLERARDRYNEAVANRARAQAAITDAIGAQRNAEAARDALVLRSSKQGGVPPAESIGAHQRVRDAEQHVGFLREALTAADAATVAAQRALNEASGECHRPVLEHAVTQRIQAAARLDAIELELAEAREQYDATTWIINEAMLRGARHPGGPHLSRGPYGGRPGEHEAAERRAWGRAAPARIAAE